MQVRKLDDACIFYLASLPKEVFAEVEKVFDFYSKVTWKDRWQEKEHWARVWIWKVSTLVY